MVKIKFNRIMTYTFNLDNWEAEVDDPQGMLASKSSYNSELQVQCLHMYKQRQAGK